MNRQPINNMIIEGSPKDYGENKRKLSLEETIVKIKGPEVVLGDQQCLH